MPNKFDAASDATWRVTQPSPDAASASASSAHATARARPAAPRLERRRAQPPDVRRGCVTIAADADPATTQPPIPTCGPVTLPAQCSSEARSRPLPLAHRHRPANTSPGTDLSAEIHGSMLTVGFPQPRRHTFVRNKQPRSRMNRRSRRAAVHRRDDLVVPGTSSGPSARSSQTGPPVPQCASGETTVLTLGSSIIPHVSIYWPDRTPIKCSLRPP